MSQIREFVDRASSSKAIPVVVFFGVLFLSSYGFCDGTSSAPETEMNKMASSVVETIFAPWVRKTALALGGGLGIFQSIGAGSFKPFMTWGGIGLLINYIPKLVNFLSSMGGT